MEQSEFLSYLSNELDLYYQIPSTYSQVKYEKKQYINGLMKASRFFGVSFENIQEVINRESKGQIAALAASGRTDELYEIPAFIRENKAIHV
ncbi:hypothetical protein GCM10007916_25290 [Psychromonas marina]|uniref:XRE family transcriptional regulator n=1 Tax=Psychromonas marina TaxID=88364 RepID=A0ABQ6E2N4_9GAMM|nr:hypothetical protein [Psychromonas marina]GLS91460.1 hypothetical protein GCM10007916_25290 [Psychromonas marina]